MAFNIFINPVSVLLKILITDFQNIFTTDYRHGFNGKKNDNELKGNGNQQDYRMRISDSRLGRFLFIDPLSKSYPWYTPYQFAGNTPIQAKDLESAEPDFVIKKMETQGMRKT